jgi:iron complex outermembrane recepter protein
LLYTSISRGYRSGGWNADFISTLENFQFNPEYAVNYELGAKSTLAEHRVTLNASLFSTKFHDFQILQFLTTSSGSTLITYTNAGKVTSQGLEVEANAKLTTHLTASLNAAFTQAKFDEFKNGGGLGIHYDGNYLPFAPKESYYAAFDYRRTLTQKISFYGHLDYGYSGNYFSHPDNSSTNSIEGHFIANSRVGVTLGSDWDISLWLKNLTNESNLRQRSVSFLRVPRGYYDPPRLFGITFRYSF